MLPDLHDLRLHVQVVYRGHHRASCGYAKGGILYYLELANICGGYIWEPDWGGVTKKGVNKGLICSNEGLLLLAPCGASEGLQEREPVFSSLDQISCLAQEKPP